MQVYPLCKEKNMNVISMSYTGKVLWTVWELDVEDYEILFILLIMWLSAMPTWDEMVMSLIYYEDILDDVARDMTLHWHVTSSTECHVTTRGVKYVLAVQPSINSLDWNILLGLICLCFVLLNLFWSCQRIFWVDNF